MTRRIDRTVIQVCVVFQAFMGTILAGKMVPLWLRPGHEAEFRAAFDDCIKAESLLLAVVGWVTLAALLLHARDYWVGSSAKPSSKTDPDF